MSDCQFFISYRRSTDAEAAGRLAEELMEHFPQESIFLDVSPVSLEPGTVWPETLRSGVAGCKVLLAVIGPGWFEELKRRNRDPGGRWLEPDATADWVRLEIGTALSLGKVLIPVLVQGAQLPPQGELPDDLAELHTRQSIALPHFGKDRQEAINKLLRTLFGGSTPGTPDRWIPDDRSRTRVDTVYSRFGQPWSPGTERDSPHAFDYKFSVLSPAIRQAWRDALLEAGKSGVLRRPVSMGQVRSSGEHRKFAASERKHGMFFQASCVITDGMDAEQFEHVLLCVRDEFQMHSGDQIRHVQGESILFGTCLSSFDFHDDFGHVPVDLFTGSEAMNPWALFSRKLLIPDTQVAVRFAGIGFNFRSPAREYVHLIWHVRTQRRPAAMLVPARAREKFDVPVWRTREEAARYDFEKAPIDREVATRFLGLDLPSLREHSPADPVGFVTCAEFQNTMSFRAPVPWRRDAVTLDLLLMYQQEVHLRGRRIAPVTPAELLEDLRQFIRSWSRDDLYLRVDVRPAPFAIDPEIPCPLFLTIRERSGPGAEQPHQASLITAWVSEAEELTRDVAERCRAQVLGLLPYSGTPEPTLFVVHGVETSLRFRLQGAVCLDGVPPVHVVKVATKETPASRPVKDVSHAIIPVRKTSDGPPTDLIVTRSEEDELSRLPGGKIEAEELPAQALYRELHEELGLLPNDIQRATPIPGSPICLEGSSPSSGELTMYRLHPFIVALTDSGTEKIRKRLASTDGEIRVVLCRLDDWYGHGLGFDPSYARQVRDSLVQEQLIDAAVALE